MTHLEPGQVRAEGLGRWFRLERAGSTLRGRLLGYESGQAREFWAVRGVDLEIQPGEAFGIVGRNGSGKSTLLKMLARIYGPSEGSCGVGGRLSSLLELGAGFHPEFSAVENIYLSSAIYGIPRDEIRRDLDAIIGFAELEDFAHQPVKTFSSGMFARLGFSVAMHVRPDVLLLDEVLAVGDEAFVQKCMGRIAEYRRNGGTMVLVTHDANVVERVCDRALFLEGGIPVITDTAAKVIRTYHEHLVHDATAHATEARTENGFAVRLEILDATGSSRQIFTEGEPFSLRGVVDSTVDLSPAQINIEFKDGNGRPLTGNTLTGIDFTPGSQRSFELHVPSPPFRDGSFSVTLSIWDGLTQESRFHEDAIETLMVIGDSADTGGSIRLNAQWGE